MERGQCFFLVLILKKKYVGEYFLLFQPAVGGLLPPVAGREGAAAEKIKLSGFFGGKVNERSFALLHHLAAVLKGQIFSFMIMTEMIENFNNDSSCIF